MGLAKIAQPRGGTIAARRGGGGVAEELGQTKGKENFCKWTCNLAVFHHHSVER